MTTTTDPGLQNRMLVEELETAYWMEIETVQNCIANSVNLNGVRAEEGAIETYRRIIQQAEEARDYVTADLVTTILADEEAHRREFAGFLKEYER